MTSNNRLQPAFIFLFALIVRLLAILLWKDDCQYLHSDPSEYVSLAYHLKAGQGFSFGEAHPWGADGRWNFARSTSAPAVARAPLYPAMIAALWWGTEPPVLAVRVTQAILGALIAALTYLIADRLFNKKVATTSAFVMACLPLSCYLTVNIMTLDT